MYKIAVETYKTSGEFHYVKVSIDGLYVSGIKVSESRKYQGTLWIQMPSYRQGNKWKRYIETSNDSRLGNEIYKAIESYMSPIVLQKNVVNGSFGDGLEEPISLDGIPFK